MDERAVGTNMQLHIYIDWILLMIGILLFIHYLSVIKRKDPVLELEFFLWLFFDDFFHHVLYTCTHSMV